MTGHEARDDEREAPNEAGLYVDGSGNVWRLWRDGIFAMLSSDERQDPRQYAPFTRLHTIAEIESAGYRKHPEPEVFNADPRLHPQYERWISDLARTAFRQGWRAALEIAAVRVPVGEGEQ